MTNRLLAPSGLSFLRREGKASAEGKQETSLKAGEEKDQKLLFTPEREIGRISVQKARMGGQRSMECLLSASLTGHLA